MTRNQTDEARPLQYRPGVGIMLLNSRNEVLVCRRADVPSDAWQMPQGGIRPGESAQSAARRELWEEVGVHNAEIVAETKAWLRYELPPELLSGVPDGRWCGQQQKWFLMRFAGADSEIDLNTRNPEFDTWKWVPIRELPELVISFKRQVYLNLVSEFSQSPVGSERQLAELLIRRIVAMRLTADGVTEENLYELLNKVVAEKDFTTAAPRQ